MYTKYEHSDHVHDIESERKPQEFNMVLEERKNGQTTQWECDR